ncbi:hypothetical protein LCGC14_1130930 [marine sediment metagenome]|uniref:Uncharacterized protein n=1 Tax=marine sediment metagenome TaxID=412755 RepID=A0A0F9MNW3_9ZZZZ
MADSKLDLDKMEERLSLLLTNFDNRDCEAFNDILYANLCTALLAVRAAKREEGCPETLPLPCRCGGGYTVSDRGTCDHCGGIVVFPPAESAECEQKKTTPTIHYQDGRLFTPDDFNEPPDTQWGLVFSEPIQNS